MTKYEKLGLVMMLTALFFTNIGRAPWHLVLAYLFFVAEMFSFLYVKEVPDANDK